MKLQALLRAAAFALIFGARALVSQQAPDSPGPAVGAKVPEFQLSDEVGTYRSLRSLMGPKGLMLVFFRSADW